MNMHQVAAGSAGPIGLVGSLALATEPPLSTETIGRAPSFLELPVPLQAVPARQPEPAVDTLDGLAGPVESPVQMAELLPRRELPAEAPATAERRRVVVRLVGDEELYLGTFDERTAALARAKDAIATFAAAESAGEWPELDGRHLRPNAILSVDILVEGH